LGTFKVFIDQDRRRGRRRTRDEGTRKIIITDRRITRRGIADEVLRAGIVIDS